MAVKKKTVRAYVDSLSVRKHGGGRKVVATAKAKASGMASRTLGKQTKCLEFLRGASSVVDLCGNDEVDSEVVKELPIWIKAIISPDVDAIMLQRDFVTAEASVVRSKRLGNATVKLMDDVIEQMVSLRNKQMGSLPNKMISFVVCDADDDAAADSQPSMNQD